MLYLACSERKLFRLFRRTLIANLSNIMKKIITLVALLSAFDAACAGDEIVGNPKAAVNKVAMCIGCHGIPDYKSSFPEVYPVPMLGGQSAKYLENALQAYKKGDRNHPTMHGIAAGLSDQDIADLAAYYAQQTKSRN